MRQLETLISVVSKELSMRHWVYARRVNHGQMTQAEMDAGISEMEDVRLTLQSLLPKDLFDDVFDEFGEPYGS